MGSRQTVLEDLTKCGICKETITDPRALPCLHTYCLDCLREWCRTDSKDVVTCPVCKKDVDLPSEGVDGFPGNFFVSSMLDRNLPSATKTRNCICCEESTNELIARCLECDGFLCQKGTDIHKTFLAMKSHQIISIADLKSGRIDVRKFSKPPNCSKHKDQTLWLFCETCGVLICQGCTVLNHCQPEHKYKEIESVIGEQKESIERLEQACEKVGTQINEDIARMITTKENLDNAVTKAALEIENAGAMWKKHIDELCKEETKKLRAWETTTNEEIREKREGLDGEVSRLKTAQNMAKQILLSGSDHDVASVYVQLTGSLEEVSKRAPQTHECARFNVDFVAEDTAKIADTVSDLGTLKLGGSE